MAYVRFYKYLQYINNEPTGVFRKGELVDDTTYEDYNDCTNVAPLTRWVETQQTMCDDVDLCAVEKEQISYDNGATWVDTGNTRAGDIIEAGSSQCVESMTVWRTIAGEFVCDEGDKYTKEAEYISYDGGSTWTATGNERKGSLLEEDSEDCHETPVETYKATLVYYSGEVYNKEIDGNPTLTATDVTRGIDNQDNPRNKRYITSATVYPSVTTIGGGAFRNCSLLRYAEIKEGVTTINSEAFISCYNLTDILLPESLTSIGYGAFKASTLSGTLSIPNVTSIGQNAFQGCDGLTSLELSDNLTSISNYAFKECTGLTSIEIPDSVTTIGYESFRDCDSVESITIGSGVTLIENKAFYSCNNLRTITALPIVPPDTQEGMVQVLCYCTNLIAIYVPAQSVEAYKNHVSWRYYADIIQPIPEN